MILLLYCKQLASQVNYVFKKYVYYKDLLSL